MFKTLTSDKKINDLILAEEKRQGETISLIPSENYVSKAVQQAVSSVFINKYSEGLPGKRYYQGNQVVDELESLCQKRALAVFGLSEGEWGVNVQALSGSPANLAVISALCLPGERIMSMYLPDGGHLSHGWQLPDKKVTLVSKIWDIHFYHVAKNTEVFDYNQIEKQALQVKPKLIISGGTAYPREIDHVRMGEIARKAGAYYLADIAHEAGLVAGGVNKPPFPHADVVTMTTHKTLRGPRGALIFSRRNLSHIVDQAVFPGLQGGPHNQTIAGIAVALGEASGKEFKDYAKQIVRNAQVLADGFLKADFNLVSGGTDKHLLLLNLHQSGISAWIAAWALEYAGIVANRNTVPYETGSPFYPSGLRIGTPAVTTRGMKEKEMTGIASIIIDVLAAVKDYSIPGDRDKRQEFLNKIQNQLRELDAVKKARLKVGRVARDYPVPS